MRRLSRRSQKKRERKMKRMTKRKRRKRKRRRKKSKKKSKETRRRNKLMNRNHLQWFCLQQATPKGLSENLFERFDAHTIAVLYQTDGFLESQENAPIPLYPITKNRLLV